MSSPLVTIVAWRRVADDPPANQQLVVTDAGFARWDTHARRFCTSCGGLRVLPEPTVWCVPSPPAPGGLTLDDVRYLLGVLDSLPVQPYDRMEATARLRAALATEKGEGT